METNEFGIPQDRIPVGYSDYPFTPFEQQDRPQRPQHPLNDFPAFANPWPQVMQPVRLNEVNPATIHLLHVYGNDPIPARILALATTPTPDWMLRYKQRRDELLGPLSQSAQTVKGFIQDNLSRPGTAISEAARQGADAFSRIMARLENEGTPQWQAIPLGVAQSLPDLARGAWVGASGPGPFRRPGDQAAAGIENSYLRNALRDIINTIATPQLRL